MEITTTQEGTMDTTETLVEALRAECEERESEATWIGLCDNGVHLRAARQIRPTCGRCGQPLGLGNVGPHTWCDRERCHRGSHNHQHWCGEWNPPIEVETDIRPAAAELDAEMPADAAETVIRERAAEMIDELLARLEKECDEQARAKAERVRKRLLENVRQVRAELDQAIAEHGPLPPRDDKERAGLRETILIEAGLTLNPDHEPCVFLDEQDRLAAWDMDPASLEVTCEGDLVMTGVIEVTESDLAAGL